MSIAKHYEKQIIQEGRKFAFPEYDELIEMREIVSDCLNGQSTIKSKEKYLPKSKWQEKYPEKYREFLKRALFPSETKKSLDTYTGLFNLGSPKIKYGKCKDLEYLTADAANNLSIQQLQVITNKKQISSGLHVILAEIRDDPERPFFFQQYDANAMLRTHFRQNKNDSSRILDLVLLNESFVENDIASWTYNVIPQFKVLALDRNMRYYQRTVKPDELLKLDILNPPADSRTNYPTYQGKPYNRIPVAFAGAETNSFEDFDMPSLLPIAEADIKLFMCSAHNSQHIYMNTQESIVITGASNSFKLKDDEFVAGAVIVIPGDNAKAQYVSTNGVGFAAEEKEIERIQNNIEQSRLTLMSAKTHQSNATVGVSQNSKAAPLRTIAINSGIAITDVMRHMALWMGYSRDDAETLSYEPSEEFANVKVNLAEFIALCKAQKVGEVQMTQEDLYTIAKSSGYINSQLSWEQFKEKYDIEWKERTETNVVLMDPKPSPTDNGGNPYVTKNNTNPYAQ